MSEPAVPTRIDSAKNPLVAELRRLRERGDAERVFAEGARLVLEGLAAGLAVERVLRADAFAGSEHAAALAEALELRGIAAQPCSDAAMARISGLEAAPGIVAVFARPRPPVALLRPDAWLCIAAGVRDPGNLGALVRCSEAAGASGFVALEGSADPFRDKALRASAGSAFRLPCLGAVRHEELEAWVRDGLRLITTEADGDVPLWEAEFGPGPLGFVVGAEGAGIPPELAALAALRVRIPMCGAVESLNVAVAAGLVLFEQRRRLELGGAGTRRRRSR